MFQRNFILTELNPRTNTAILFLALAIFVLLNDNISVLKKRALFFIFFVSCLISHYSTTYIFFLIMLMTFLGESVFPLKSSLFNRSVSLTTIFLFFAMIFFWYSQITETSFNNGVIFLQKTVENLNKIFFEELRGSNTNALLGKNILQKGIPHQTEFILTWLTFAVIGIGVIQILAKYKETLGDMKPAMNSFLENRFNVTYIVISIICCMMLILVVVAPFVSVGYSLDRVYAVTIILLSVFFVIGGMTLSSYTRIPAWLIIMILLVPYFLCVSGFMYNLFGYPRAILLNSHGEDQYDYLYVHDQEVSGATWLKDNMLQKAKAYSDYYGAERLSSLGMIYPSTYAESFVEHNNSISEGYFYLRYAGSVNNKLMDRRNIWHNISSYSAVLDSKNVIYDAGGSRVIM
ncbi:MAG: DUF2206 domain-containing protein [Candidatus Altiarchaeia archaeon]